MTYRYVNPIGNASDGDFATVWQAREAAILAGVGMKLHQLLQKSKRERQVLWTLLEEAGWSVRYLS